MACRKATRASGISPCDMRATASSCWTAALPGSNREASYKTEAGALRITAARSFDDTLLAFDPPVSAAMTQGLLEMSPLDAQQQRRVETHVKLRLSLAVVTLFLINGPALHVTVRADPRVPRTLDAALKVLQCTVQVSHCAARLAPALVAVCEARLDLDCSREVGSSACTAGMHQV